MKQETKKTVIYRHFFVLGLKQPGQTWGGEHYWVQSYLCYSQSIRPLPLHEWQTLTAINPHCTTSSQQWVHKNWVQNFQTNNNAKISVLIFFLHKHSEDTVMMTTGTQEAWLIKGVNGILLQTASDSTKCKMTIRRPFGFVSQTGCHPPPTQMIHMWMITTLWPHLPQSSGVMWAHAFWNSGQLERVVVPPI
jgi:hypothetical protein